MPRCKDCKYKGDYFPGSDVHVYCGYINDTCCPALSEDEEHPCEFFQPKEPKPLVRCCDCGWSHDGATDPRFLLCGCLKQQAATKATCVVKDVERECEWFVKAVSEEPDDGRNKERLKQWAMKGNIKEMRQWWDGFKEGYETCLSVVEVFESGIIEEAEEAE